MKEQINRILSLFDVETSVYNENGKWNFKITKQYSKYHTEEDIVHVEKNTELECYLVLFEYLIKNYR